MLWLVALPPGAIVFIIGHSFGANTILIALRKMRRKVSLLCAIDPAAQFDTTLPPNCVKALGFRQVVSSIGRGKLLPAGDGRIIDIVLNDSHTYIDKDPRTHAHIISEIVKI